MSKCIDCPKCGKRGVRRHGVHFDHEYRCGDCSVVWNPDERTPMASVLKVLNDVLGERLRQVTKGFTAETDDTRRDGVLPFCAAMIADPSGDLQERSATGQIRSFSEDGWEAERSEHVCCKHDRRRQLIISAAMIVAEIERLDRRVQVDR